MPLQAPSTYVTADSNALADRGSCSACGGLTKPTVPMLVCCPGLGGVVAPGWRNETHDWALEGYRMRSDDMQYVADRVEAFKAAIPAYPGGVFQVRLCLACKVSAADCVLHSF